MTNDPMEDKLREVEELAKQGRTEEADALMASLSDAQAPAVKTDSSEFSEDIEAFFAGGDMPESWGGAELPTVVLEKGDERVDGLKSALEEAHEQALKAQESETELNARLEKLRQEEEDRQEKLKEAQAELEALKSALEAQAETDKAEEERRKKLESTIGSMNSELDVLRSERAEATSSKEELAKELERLRDSETARQQELAKATDQMAALKKALLQQQQEAEAAKKQARDAQAAAAEAVIVARASGGGKGILLLVVIAIIAAGGYFGATQMGLLGTQKGGGPNDVVQVSPSGPTDPGEGGYDPSEGKTPPPGPRSVTFPAGTSIGTVFTRQWGSRDANAWTKLGTARGEVQIAAGKEIKLLTSIDAGMNLEPLKDIPDGALDVLALKGPHVNDDNVRFATHMTHLKGLELLATEVTRTGLERFAGFTELRELKVFGSKIDPAGFAVLRNFGKLERLDFDKTPIGTEGMKIVRQLTSLKKIILDPESTDITQLTLLELAMPYCDISPTSEKLTER